MRTDKSYLVVIPHLELYPALPPKMAHMYTKHIGFPGKWCF